MMITHSVPSIHVVSRPFTTIVGNFDCSETYTTNHEELSFRSVSRRLGADWSWRHTPRIIPYGSRASKGTGMIDLIVLRVSSELDVEFSSRSHQLAGDDIHVMRNARSLSQLKAILYNLAIWLRKSAIQNKSKFLFSSWTKSLPYSIFNRLSCWKTFYDFMRQETA